MGVAGLGQTTLQLPCGFRPRSLVLSGHERRGVVVDLGAMGET